MWQIFLFIYLLTVFFHTNLLCNMQLDLAVSSFIASGNFISLLSVLRLLLTKCCRLGGLNNINFFLTVDRKLKIRVLTDSAPREESASCLCVWPRSHCVHTRWRERHSDLCCLFLCCKAPALLRLYMTSFNLYYILKSLSPNAVTVGIRDSTYQLGVGENTVQS